MTEAVNTLKELTQMFWNAFDSVRVPILNISFLVFFLGLMVFNLITMLLSTLTNGSQDKDEKARLDNNNNYIYRR